MKYEYKTDKQLADERPRLKDGAAQFRVDKSIEGVSKAGNSQIKLTLKVWDIDGQAGTVFDYLSSGYIPKIKSFCAAIGHPEWYAMDHELVDSDLVGKTGQCNLKWEDGDQVYAGKSIVHFYIEKEQNSGFINEKKEDDVSFFDDELPQL